MSDTRRMVIERVDTEKVPFPRPKSFRKTILQYARQELSLVKLGLDDAFRDPLIILSRLFFTKAIDAGIRPAAAFSDHPPETSNGIGLLMCHGFGGSPQMFDDVIEPFVKQGYHVRTVRLSGHGTTPGHFATTSGTEWLASVVYHYKQIRKKYDHIYFIGHSIGGTLGMILATIYPIERLACLASPIKLNIPPAKLAREISLIVKYWPRSKHKRKVIKELGLQTYSVSPLYATMGVFEIQTVLRERAQLMQTPTLYVKGAHDKRSFQDQHDIFAEVFKGIKMEIHVAEDAGHSVFLSPDKDQIVGWISDWFTRDDL